MKYFTKCFIGEFGKVFDIRIVVVLSSYVTKQMFYRISFFFIESYRYNKKNGISFAPFTCVGYYTILQKMIYRLALAEWKHQSLFSESATKFMARR